MTPFLGSTIRLVGPSKNLWSAPNHSFYPSGQRLTRALSSLRDEERHILLEHRRDESGTETPDAVVSVLTLNRPKSANAMGSLMLTQLKESLSELEESQNNSRCLVLTSASSKVFSAGADLKERKTMTINQAEEFVTDLRSTMDRVSRLQIPVLAAIEGVAVGGGLELALAADLRIASGSAKLGLPETTLAIVPGAGGTQRLPRAIGVARAKEMIWTGRIIDGATAAEYGLVQHVVPPGETLQKAMELAWTIARNSGPVAIRAAKFAIDEGMMAPNMWQALEIEREAYGRVLHTRDRLEGLRAFQEGRKPVYRGD